MNKLALTLPLCLLASAVVAVTSVPFSSKVPLAPLPHQPVVVDQPEVVQPAAWTSDGPLSVAAMADRSGVAKDSHGQVRVKVMLVGETTEQSLDVPTDVTVVMDVSGSMSGQKLQDAKRALGAITGALGLDDRLALVTFESGATFRGRFFGGDHALPGLVRGLRAGGGTDMVAGLETAWEVAERVPGRSGRVILISDGAPNTEAGLPNLARQAVTEEMPLTTVGIGDGYNERLMTSLADLGTGNFFWAGDDLPLEEVFQAELNDASAMVASGAQLVMPLGGAQIVEAGGLPIRRADGQQVVDLGSVFSGQERSLWLTLALPTSELGPLALPDLKVQYRTLAGDLQGVVAALPTIEVLPTPAAALATLDKPLYEEGTVQEAWTQVEFEVSQLVQAGDLHGAKNKVAAYRTRVHADNQVLKSAVVDENLAQSVAFEADLERQFEGADQAQKRNQWSKSTNASAYSRRRVGQSSRF